MELEKSKIDKAPLKPSIESLAVYIEQTEMVRNFDEAHVNEFLQL